jgi:hypothetical protein
LPWEEETGIMKLTALLALAVILQQDSCQQMVDTKALTGAVKYFPKAKIIKCYPTILHIETHVGNVTREFATFAMDNLLEQYRQEFESVPARVAGGYGWVILGFDDYNAVWRVGSPKATTMDMAEFANFVTTSSVGSPTQPCTEWPTTESRAATAPAEQAETPPPAMQARASVQEDQDRYFTMLFQVEGRSATPTLGPLASMIGGPAAGTLVGILEKAAPPEKELRPRWIIRGRPELRGYNNSDGVYAVWDIQLGKMAEGPVPVQPFFPVPPPTQH